MCGITAYYGKDRTGKVLFDSLKRLEYRGYDSAGIAVLSNPKTVVKKDTGDVDEINEKLNLEEMEGVAGIGHTRWATHGGVTKENAHPHLSCDKRFALVHNGIINNWKELKKGLDDHHFKSETDSEVIVHFIEERSKNKGVEEAIQEFLKVAEGSFAVVLLDSKTKKMYAFKRSSPLALGIDEELYLGSDIYAFSPYTNRAIFFKDNEYAVLDNDGYVFKDEKGATIEKKPQEFNWEQEESGRKEFDHYMRKEIGEIPTAIKRLQRSLKSNQKDKLKRFVKKLEDAKKVLFTASGTSYHASLLCVYLLQKSGIKAQTLIASEFKNYERVDEDTLLIAISQSGETRDVLDAIEYSEEMDADIASIVNVPYSTIERKSDISLRIRAGQEICVAATKTFTNQLYLLLRLANELGHENGISTLPEKIKRVIQKNEKRIQNTAKKLQDREDIYIIGRGETYPIAREISLKLKEISYIHAEGMMGGELKHGTLALIEEGTPVISLIQNKNSEIKSNVKEVEARGAESIKISPFEGVFDLPSDSDGKFAFFSTVIGFLLTYWIDKERNLPIDKPRNLAKSCTVK